MSDKSPKTMKNKASGGWFRRNIPKVVIILAAIGVILAVKQLPQQQRQAPPTEAPPVNVTVTPVVAEPELPDTFDLPAIVEPNKIVTVSAEIEARVERIPLVEGSTVRAGDLLVQLNADLLQPAFEMAKAQVERDQIEYERMANLVKDDATPKRDLDDATTRLTVSKATLEQARARLERTRIVAPSDGILNDLPVEEGEYVQIGVPVAQVVDIDTVKVAVEIPERDIAFFEVGQTAQVLADIKGCEESMEGKITFISELADERTRSTRMEITIANKERLLRSGQIVRASLTRRILKDAILIPLLAVIPMEDGKAVYVVNSEQAQRREVKLDIIKGDRILVTSGLKPGDRLITAGHRFVAPGQKVNIVSEKE